MSSLPRNPNPNPPDGETSVNIYGYTPWRALCIVCVVVFGIALMCHIGYAVRAGLQGRRRRRGPSGAQHSEKHMHNAKHTADSIVTFETLFSFGCALEVVGYGFRTASSYNPFVLVDFILNYFMIVVAPVFFSAAQYYCLSIVLQRRKQNARRLLPLSGRAIVAIFVTFDVITIIVQVAGAALLGVSESARARGTRSPLTPEQANDILRAGLAVQVFSITVFLVLLAVLLVRLAKRRDEEDNKAPRQTFLLSILTLSAIMIYIRTVFRLVEVALGVESSASLNQGLFAALETVPVLVAVVAWTVMPLQFALAAGGDGSNDQA